jgi:predicted O-methyltransferase YrrM
MTKALWTRVESFTAGVLSGVDRALEAALASSSEAGLPAIQVSPSEGKLLHLLARSIGARSILEIGTLGGYSTIWLARGLAEGGRLITLELDEKHAEVARRNLARAGLSDVAEVRVGAALDTLPALEGEGWSPFDLVFIDADKPNNPHYFEWAVRLSRPGTMIIVDNVVREGAVADAASTDANVVGTRTLLESIGRDRRVSATAIQTVGSKGYDGFALALVLPG